MSYIKENFDTTVPRPTIMPKKWDSFVSNDNVIFNNLDHFIHTVSKLEQKEDSKCGVSYKEALNQMVLRKSGLTEDAKESIRNLVRSNLHKRGLITEEVYEEFKYSNSGTNLGVDVGKYAAGDPDCVLTPSRQYIDFFYELYISISYSWSVTDEAVRKNVAKLLATVEELERQHIYIKIVVVFPDKGPTTCGKRNFFSSIPVFHHKDFKSVDVMSSVVNERLLRKFYFAILEDLYGENLDYGYGTPVNLDKTINIGHELNEVELFEKIVNEVGA